MIEINWISLTTVMLLVFTILCTLPRTYTVKPQEKIVYVDSPKPQISKEAIREYPITDWTKLIAYRRVGDQLHFESETSTKEWYSIIPKLFPKFDLDMLSLKVWDDGKQASVRVKSWNKIEMNHETK